MSGVNKVIIIGNLGKDPELKVTEGGTPVCRLSVATTREWMNKQTNEKQSETEWHRVTVWGKSAEHCNNYLKKGRQVYVEGRLRTTSYEQDGVKKWSTEIVSETVQFLGGRSDGEGGGGNGNSEGEGGGGSGGAKPQRSGASGGNEPDPDDDVPF
jgi:single-strand DNA-binding protein